jgi:predicted DNA-binding transcriptional regulator YafY
MLLRKGRALSVAELANECGVSERTVYRDIDTISRANYPVFYDKGYKLLSTAVMPPVRFTDDELRIMSDALEAAPPRRHSRRVTIRRIREKLDQLGGPSLPSRAASS